MIRVVRAAALVLAALGAVDLSEEEQFASAPVTVEQAVATVEATGKRPLSAGYLLAGRNVQVSVYAERGTRLLEIILEGRTGRVVSAQELPAGHERNAAESEAVVMRRSRLSIRAAIEKARAANGRLRAVGVSPMIEHGRAVARITFLEGRQRRQFVQPLE
jgi:hypothetical protein